MLTGAVHTFFFYQDNLPSHQPVPQVPVIQVHQVTGNNTHWYHGSLSLYTYFPSFQTGLYNIKFKGIILIDV